MITFSSKKYCQALGRNGLMRQSGIMFQTYPENSSGGKYANAVRLSPVTSKGIEGRAFIEIPLEDIEMVIRRLRLEAMKLWEYEARIEKEAADDENDL